MKKETLVYKGETYTVMANTDEQIKKGIRDLKKSLKQLEKEKEKDV